MRDFGSMLPIENFILISEFFWTWIMDETTCWALSRSLAKWQEQSYSHKLKKLKQFPKSAPNFMELFTRVIFHLPRVNMHEKISNHVGSHHIKGF